MKNIAVIGIGGVGGYFGGLLARRWEGDPELAVHFVARGAHLAEIKKNGLFLDAEKGKMTCRPRTATDSIAELPALDFCIVCVKGYDLPIVLGQLRERIGASTVILPLLNGVDIFERTRAVVQESYLHPACVYVSTHLEKPGLVVQRGSLAAIFLGADPGGLAENRSILPLLDAAGINYGWKDDPFAEIWIKYLFIAPFGLVTADSGKTIGEVILSAEHLNTVKGIMKEIIVMADRKGIELPATVMEDTLTKAAKFPFDTRTSFQRDFEAKGKPDERDLFGGSILRMGKELGVLTPLTEKVYASIMQKKPDKAAR
ncbi:MAG: 2-dehydropantoate 2-reductase [Spirochaetes bacterium]|nr:2-dehydropantoate 2-reductase [Spirochaetota bacterium]